MFIYKEQLTLLSFDYIYLCVPSCLSRAHTHTHQESSNPIAPKLRSLRRACVSSPCPAGPSSRRGRTRAPHARHRRTQPPAGAYQIEFSLRGMSVNCQGEVTL
jgi:hypothetical protein